MEFCKSLFAAMFLVILAAPLSYQPSDAEIVIRLSLMPARSNATKEVGDKFFFSYWFYFSIKLLMKRFMQSLEDYWYNVFLSKDIEGLPIHSL